MVIADTVEALPAPDRAAHADQVEATLLEHAPSTDPHRLRMLAGGFSRIWTRTGRARSSGTCSRFTGDWP